MSVKAPLVTALNTKDLTSSAAPAIQSLDLTQVEVAVAHCTPLEAGRGQLISMSHRDTHHAIVVEFNTASLTPVTAPSFGDVCFACPFSLRISHKWRCGVCPSCDTPPALQTFAVSLLPVSVLAEVAGSNACNISLGTHLIMLVLPLEVSYR